MPYITDREYAVLCAYRERRSMESARTLNWEQTPDSKFAEELIDIAVKPYIEQLEAAQAVIEAVRYLEGETRMGYYGSPSAGGAGAMNRLFKALEDYDAMTKRVLEEE